ncbi:MAG: hypothetical protein ACFFB3_17960 [Candidatus Hodarchaeota archaeon]
MQNCCSFIFHMPFWDYYGEYWDDHWRVGPLWFVFTLLIFNLVYTMWRVGKMPNFLENSRKEDFPANMAIVTLMVIVAVITFLLRLWIPTGELFLNPQIRDSNRLLSMVCGPLHHWNRGLPSGLVFSGKIVR